MTTFKKENTIRAGETLFDPAKTLSEIQVKFKEHKIFWKSHARQRMQDRGIDRTWVREQVAEGNIQLVDFVWSHGHPEKILVNVGAPPGKQTPVHVCIINDTPKASVITVYWVDFEQFHDDGITRKRRV
ncbi:MAG: hypothetical protein A4E53_01545 [Pelotomaculum sp. PtaB.Bin104]|nr:MAG: hypothetical protein A4E53_01545 [Pelotomaculum sp. PtaB.Bin104]